MIDEKDKQTLDLELDPSDRKKRPGRPGRQVNQDNFHEVLRYFTGKRSKELEQSGWLDKAPLDELKKIEEQAPMKWELAEKPLDPALIERLQQWVLAHVSKEEWSRFRTRQRQEKYKQNHQIRHIPIPHDLFIALTVLKESSEQETWEDTLRWMIRIIRESRPDLLIPSVDK